MFGNILFVNYFVYIRIDKIQLAVLFKSVELQWIVKSIVKLADKKNYVVHGGKKIFLKCKSTVCLISRM